MRQSHASTRIELSYKVVVEKLISIDKPAIKVVLITDIIKHWLWMMAGGNSMEHQ